MNYARSQQENNIDFASAVTICQLQNLFILGVTVFYGSFSPMPDNDRCGDVTRTRQSVSGAKDKRLSLGVVAILFFLVIVFAAALYFRHEIAAPLSREGFERLVEIRQGESASAIARSLSAKGVLKHRLVFILFAALQGTTHKLRAGTYLFTSEMTIRDVHRMLLRGDTAAVKIIIPEGLTIKQVARRLKQRGLISDEEQFIELCNDAEFAQELGINSATLEGYLYPETYFFLPGTPSEEIVDAFVRTFHHQVGPLMEQRPEAGKKGALTPYEVLILASIVEREARNEAEKPTIASVYLNRLRRRMKLESCATVRYVLDKWEAPLTKADLKVDSPYNTYVHYGLPLAPICSPGKGSVLAVLHPATTDYYFYCYRGDGTHQFSRTLAEHEKAVKMFLRHNTQQQD
jgi:UPF0755 protein